MPLNLTLVMPVKSEPRMSTRVPAGPLVGVNELIVGGGGVTVNDVDVDAVPRGVVTLIGPLVAPAGTVAWSSESESRVYAAVLPPIVTEVGSLRLPPRMSTLVPAGPLVGVNIAIIGGR